MASLIEPKAVTVPYQTQFDSAVFSQEPPIVIVDEVYLKGEYGMFKVGTMTGQNRVQLALVQAPYDAKRWENEIKAKVVAAGYELAKPFMDTSWRFVYGR